MIPRFPSAYRPRGRFVRPGHTRPGRARRWAVPVAVLVGAAAGGGYGLVSTPQYEATGYVVVVPAGRSDPAAAMGLAQVYGRVAADVAVTGGVPARAGVSPGVLRDSVRAETSPDAPMISITARAQHPATAAGIADGVAGALVRKGTDTRSSTGVEVVHFSRAARPAGPVSPSAPLSALVGGCAGGLLGGLALLVRPWRGPGERYAPVPGPAVRPEAV